MVPGNQMAALSLNAIEWFGFCRIAITTSLRLTTYFADNFQLVDGPDDTMKCWFYITVPIACMLMTGCVVGNWLDDWNNFRFGQQICNQAVIGGGHVMSDGSWVALVSLGVTIFFRLETPVLPVIFYWVIGCSFGIGLVLWGIYTGKFPPTKAAGVSVAHCIIVGLISYPLNKIMGGNINQYVCGKS